MNLNRMHKGLQLGLGTAVMIGALSACQTIQSMTGAGPMGSAFGDLDLDGDGVVSPQEAQGEPALAGNFKRIDTNASGGIDPDEYAAAHTNLADVQFGEVDVNGDGVISQREAASMPISLQDAFDRVDSDGDGNVSPTEYSAATVNLMDGLDFASIDGDGDGVIDPKEAEEAPALNVAFDRVDSDGDGQVSKAELQHAQR